MPKFRDARIIPTDTLSIPEQEDVRPIQDLMAAALNNRPDLAQAQLQVANSQIGLVGSRSATLPEVDLVGMMQNNGLAGTTSPTLPNAYPGYIGGYGSALEQVLARNYPTYGVGVQVTLPIHNRVAEADLARDEIQVKQPQVRVGQLQNQARLEVEDAVIAMRRARASYQAAQEARRLPAGVARGRAGQVRNRHLHVVLRDSVSEPAGAGQIHRNRRAEFLGEGAGRAGARHRHDSRSEPHLLRQRRQR